jgi:Zn-dependent peptidase ImmA (M78 family)
LSSEVLRAEYLLKRAGVDLAQAEKEGVGAAFLMTQIALRERLESADSAHPSERDALSVEIRDRYNASREAFASAAEDERFKEAACYWQEMCYLSKLRDATRVRAA